eukprot:gene26872-32475_t
MSAAQESVPETPQEANNEELSPAEHAKKLGNDAFLLKDYTKALEHYSEAIRLEPTNAVYYSNRSACHSLLKDFQKACEDAKESIRLDAKFLRGYFRLASAQGELGQFADAENTLKAVLALEPVVALTSPLSRWAKKAPAKVTKQLDEAQYKEYVELQEQNQVYNKDLRAVRAKLAGLQREQRVNNITAHQVTELPADTPMYRAVGKAFFKGQKDRVAEDLEREHGELVRGIRECMDRQEFLERRIQSNMTNIAELVK